MVLSEYSYAYLFFCCFRCGPELIFEHTNQGILWKNRVPCSAEQFLHLSLSNQQVKQGPWYKITCGIKKEYQKEYMYKCIYVMCLK